MMRKSAELAARQGNAIEFRYHVSAAMRRQLNKVFDGHWSFLLGEIAFGHPIPLEYQVAAIPKRMNKLGSAGAPGSRSFLTADPSSEHEALLEAQHAGDRRALTALAEHQARNGSTNGSDDTDGSREGSSAI